MFDTVFIDTSLKPQNHENLNMGELKLKPFLYLIANHIWESDNIEISNRYGLVFKSGYMINEDGYDMLLMGSRNSIPSGAVLFSPSDNIKKYNLMNQGLKSENSILLLAAAGMRMFLPNFTFDTTRLEELCKIKKKLRDERDEYLFAIAKIADESFERISNGTYEDTTEWALNEAFMKIKSSAEKIEVSFRKIDRNLLKKIGYDLFVEGVPCIVSSLEEKGVNAAASEVMVTLLKTLSSNLAKNLEGRKYPEAIYGYKLKKSYLI